MSDVKRYWIDAYYNGLDTWEDSDGEWVQYEDVEEYIAELEAQNKQLVEIILSEVEYYQPNGEYMPETEAFYCDGVVYGLEKAAAIVKAALKEKDDE